MRHLASASSGSDARRRRNGREPLAGAGIELRANRGESPLDVAEPVVEFGRQRIDARKRGVQIGHGRSRGGPLGERREALELGFIARRGHQSERRIEHGDIDAAPLGRRALGGAHETPLQEAVARRPYVAHAARRRGAHERSRAGIRGSARA